MNPRRFRAMRSRLIRKASGGLEITLRRSATLKNARHGRAIVSLLVAEDAAADATSLSLQAADATGLLPHGAQLSIAGDATTYTTTADRRPDKLGRIADVPIDTPLAAPAASSAVVTISRRYGDAVYRAQQVAFDEEIAETGLKGVTRRLNLDAAEGRRAPSEGDQCIAGLDRIEYVGHVTAADPGAGIPVGWSVLMATQPGVS